MENSGLITRAANLIELHQTKGGLCGDVASVVLSQEGNIFSGVCTATGSNVFCAEQIALGAMVSAKEYRFKKIVAVWKDEQGNIYVIPPCGNCRQYMRELTEENLASEIILDKTKTVLLKDLLPYFDWWKRQ